MANHAVDRREAPSGAAGSEPFSVPLTESDRLEIAELSTARKAEWIVRRLIEDRFGPGVRIERDHEGADLRFSRDGRTERIEVKGTRKQDLAWAQLKVSSRQSCDALRSGAASMYRVTDVDGNAPRVHVLQHGRDYELVPEPRWAVRRVPPDENPYPLRGRPYRYDLPYEPVASDEWRVPE